MKKIIFFLLLSITGYSQAILDEGIELKGNGPTVSTSKIISQEPTNGLLNYIDAVSLPLSTAANLELIKKQFLSTGLVQNGLITINGDNTKFNITAGVGVISNFDNPNAPVSTIINFGPFTGITPAYLATGNITYLAINSSGAIVQQATDFTTSQRRDLILLGAVIHSNLTNINVVNNISAPTNADTNQLHDFMNYVGALNLDGNKYTPNGANLSLNKSAGTIFKFGVNFANDWKRPHELAQSLQTLLTFRYRTQNGTESGDLTVLNPALYDLNNVLTAVPNNRFTIQTVTIFQTGLTRIQYGQTLYNSLADAEAAILTRDYVVENNIKMNGITRAYIILKGDATSLLDPAKAHITEAQKFGGVASGGVALTLANIVTALGYTPANDADVVKLTGNQTIAGIKTFDNINLNTNPISSNIYNIGQTTSSDYWKIYGKYDVVDKSEMVFEVGDNGFNWVDGGERWRFHSSASGGGVAKDPFIIEYNDIYANANLTATTFVKSGGLSTQFLKANGSVDATTYQPLLTNPITGTGIVNRIPKFLTSTTQGNSNFSDDGTLTASSTDMTINGVRFGRGLGNIASNIGIGGGNFSASITGTNSVALGSNALNRSLGFGNMAIGAEALYWSTTGSFNVGIGTSAGMVIADGTTNNVLVNSSIFIGNQTRAQANNQTNQIVIGASAIGNGSNSTVIGTPSTTKTTLFGRLLQSLTDNGVDSGQFSGTVSGSPATLSNQFVTKSQLDLKADLISPTFTGVPSVPTAIAGTNTTQIASTSFVNSAVTLSASKWTQTGNNIANNNTGNVIVGNGTFSVSAVGNVTANYIYPGTIEGGRVINLNGISNTSKLFNYDTDISSTYTDRSFTDKGYVDKNRMKSYTVATLPASPTQGDSYAVTDALTPAYLVTVVGGGTVYAPVVWNGTNWVSH
jgi:hypothetical protein